MENLEYKNGDSSEDDTFHTTSKTAENVKRVIFIVKVLAWNWLKWRGKSVPKECCDYFSHPLDVYIWSKSWTKSLDQKTLL